MASNLAHGIVYVGAPIVQHSESKFLASAIRGLEERKIPFVVLANFHIGGRQIDCVIAAASAVLVVEVKASFLAVRGEINGVWSRLHASGDWLPYSNAYEQALTAKNLLRNAMASAKAVGSFYPDGHVVFTSGLAEGSQVTRGDFKVQVQTLDEFMAGFGLRGASPWTLGDWRTFASKLSLASVTVDEVVSAPEVRSAHEVLRQYTAALTIEYGREARRWLSEDAEQRAALLSAATSGSGCFITGPSGCGKTLMAKWVAFECADAGNPTFFFAAKNYTGSWSAALRREVGLLFDQDLKVLMRAVSRTDRPVFLILDGINELGEDRHSTLRGMRALARRLGAKLVVTGQGTPPPELGGLHELTVGRPSFGLKRRIAETEASALSQTALEVLKAVGSGIEANIVGQIGGNLHANASRLTLIDEYVRQRLGAHARSASMGLRRLASVLQEQIAFSLAEHRFDELMRVHEVSFIDCEAMFAGALLVRRAGRVSFAHEMIQNACAAFELALIAEENPIAFGDRLSTALLEGIAGDAVAAIESTSTCRAVLERVTNTTLLYAARTGALGPIAMSVAQKLLEESADACEAEIRNARLVLVPGEDAPRLEWAEDFRRHWTDAEEARLGAIGRCGARGIDLDTCLKLCAEMDQRLESERQRLKDAAREAKFALKSQSFALAYYGFGKSLGFINVARPGFSSSEPEAPQCETPSIKLRDLTSGQLYFVFENRHAILDEFGDDRFAEEFANVLRERFEQEPYHVQLSLLSAVGFARRASDEMLARLIEALKGIKISPANWAIGSSIVEALQILQALDVPDNMGIQVRTEIESLLIDDEAAVDKELALSICSGIFDHPYGETYYEEIMALDPARRHRLYRRALAAPNAKRSMNLVWLSNQVASFDDVADASLFADLAGLPDVSNPFPQEEWGGFVLAIRFLGRHRVGLPPIASEVPADRCLAEIRTLVYSAQWEPPDAFDEARQAWQRLHAMSPQLVIGCLGEVQGALLNSASQEEGDGGRELLRLDEAYLADCLEVARRFIQDRAQAQYFQGVAHRDAGPSFAFSVIARHGDRSDVDSLRALTEGHPFAKHAVVALKALDAVRHH